MLRHAVIHILWYFLVLICPAFRYTLGQPVLFQCDFENDITPLCGLSGHADDAFNWTRSERGRGTPTTGTGPSLAAHGDFFVYIESSLPRHPGDFASLVAPNLGYHGRVCVNFQYHMTGITMGSLEMAAGNHSRRPDFSRDSPNTNMVWEEAKEDVLLVPPLDWIRIIGTVGSGQKSDIGLDELKITKGCCDDCNSLWLAWLPWSDCDVTCGNGTRTRSRQCDYSKMYFNATLQQHVFRVYDLYYCGTASNDTTSCSQPACTDLAVIPCVANCLQCDNQTGLCHDGQCADRYTRAPDGQCGACAPHCKRCEDLISKCEETQCEVAHAYVDDTQICHACVDQCTKCEVDITQCDAEHCNTGYELSFAGTCAVEGTRRYIITVSLSVGGAFLLIAIITIPLLIWAYIRMAKRKAEMAELWRRHNSHVPRRSTAQTRRSEGVPIPEPPPIPYIVSTDWTTDEEDDDDDADEGSDRSSDDEDSDDEDESSMTRDSASVSLKAAEPYSAYTFGSVRSYDSRMSARVSASATSGSHTPELTPADTPSRMISNDNATFQDAK